MNVAKFAVRAIREWNPLGPAAYERRDRNKAYRKARRKKRRGEILTLEEETIMAEQTVKVILPDGTETTRMEPTIKARTSTKVAGVNVAALLGAAGLMIPYYDELNALITSACQSDHGPLAVLAGMALAGGYSFLTARLTKSPIVPGKL